MGKKKALKAHQKSFFSIHKKEILVVTFIILLGIWLLASRSQNELRTKKTTTPTATITDRYSPNKEIDLNSTLEYTLPPGWTNLSDNNYSIILRNGELKRSESGPAYLDGADIVVYVDNNADNRTAEEILSDIAKNNFGNKPDTQDVSRNGLSGAYQKINFESSTDEYVFANKDYFWTISFNCNATCPKGLITDRDAFLDSITAK